MGETFGRRTLNNYLPAVLFLALAILAPGRGYAAWFGSPSNYEECIDEYVVEAKSNTAARYFASTCNSEFNEGKKESPHKEYYKCVRQGLKGIVVDDAARIKATSCREIHLAKYLEEQKKEQENRKREAEQEKWQKLEGKYKSEHAKELLRLLKEGEEASQ